jgi:hypothetical protein
VILNNTIVGEGGREAKYILYCTAKRESQQGDGTREETETEMRFQREREKTYFVCVCGDAGWAFMTMALLSGRAQKQIQKHQR